MGKKKKKKIKIPIHPWEKFLQTPNLFSCFISDMKNTQIAMCCCLLFALVHSRSFDNVGEYQFTDACHLRTDIDAKCAKSDLNTEDCFKCHHATLIENCQNVNTPNSPNCTIIKECIDALNFADCPTS